MVLDFVGGSLVAHMLVGCRQGYEVIFIGVSKCSMLQGDNVMGIKKLIDFYVVDESMNLGHH